MSDTTICAKFLSAKDGIVAIRVMHHPSVDTATTINESAPAYAKDGGVLADALQIFERCGFIEPLRIACGKNDVGYTIVCFREGDLLVALMVPTGHVIMKSITRMSHRAMKAAIQQTAPTPASNEDAA